MAILWNVQGDCNNYMVLRGHHNGILDLCWILPRVTQCIFDFIEKANEAIEFLIKLSMIVILYKLIPSS